jgi:hypothetical protein
MKIIAFLLLVVLTMWIFFNRERIYVRDPKASVYRNGVKQSGVEVYFNYSNDILLQQNNGDRAPSRTIVQQWDKMPGIPTSLTCLRWTACLSPADHAPMSPFGEIGKSGYDPKVSMEGHLIQFVDAGGAQMRVEL